MTKMDILVQIVFGWPFILLSLGLCIAGLAWKKALLLFIGAVVFAPPALFLSGYPPLRWFSPFIPLLMLGAAYAIRRGKKLIAWLLVLPAILYCAVLAVIVLTQ